MGIKKDWLRGSTASGCVLLLALKSAAAAALPAQTNLGDASPSCGNIDLTNVSFDRVANRMERSCGVYKVVSTNVHFSSLADASLVLEYFSSTVDDANPPSAYNQVPDTGNLLASESIPGLKSGGTYDDIGDNVVVSHTLSGNVILDFNEQGVIWQTLRVASSASHSICYGNSAGPDAMGQSDGSWTSYGSQGAEIYATQLSPTVSGVGATPGVASASISLSADIAGTAYWIAVPAGSTAPSPAEIKAGADYAGVSVSGAGSSAIDAGANTFAANHGAGPGSTVAFHVVAESAEGYLGCSSQTSFTTPDVPAPPTGLSAQAGDGQVEISFSAGADNGGAITNYLYSIDGIHYTPLSPADSVSPVLVSGLSNGTTYSITLKAVNAAGDSAASATVQVTPVADSDGDGTPDTHDVFPADPVEDSDSDGDGIGDKGDAGGTGIGIRLPGAPLACDFQGPVQNTTRFMDAAPGEALDKQLNFVLTNCGSSVTIEALFGSDLPAGSVAYKVSSTGEWLEIPGATITGNKIVYTVTDNGPLDDDSVVGQITDPVTVVVQPQASGGPAVAVPTLPVYGLVALGALLGLLGVRKLER